MKISDKDWKRYLELIDYYCEECDMMYEDAERQASIDMGWELDHTSLLFN